MYEDLRSQVFTLDTSQMENGGHKAAELGGEFSNKQVAKNILDQWQQERK